MNTRVQGSKGLAKAINHFADLEYPVFVPLSEYPDYDLVVDFPNEGLKKIQVRTTTFKRPSGCYQVGLRVCGGNTKTNKVHKTSKDMIYDYLFVAVENGDLYLIPKSSITQKNMMNLTSSVEHFKLNKI